MLLIAHGFLGKFKFQKLNLLKNKTFYKGKKRVAMNDYEEIVGIKTRFENSTEAELFTYLYSFQTKWVLSGNKSVTALIEKAIHNFGLNPEKFTYTELNTNYLRCLYNIVYLQQELVKNTPDEKYEELVLIFNKIQN